MGNSKLATFTNWAPIEPNSPNERCINIYAAHSGAKWNDLDCSWELYFVCERDRSDNNENQLIFDLDIRTKLP